MTELNIMTEKSDISNKRANTENSYSDEFLAQLGVKFDFDARAGEYAREIRDIGERYFADLRAFNDQADREKYRTQYRRLKKEIADFAEFLARPEYADIETDMYFAALRLREPPPKTEFPQLTEHQKKRGAPYLVELIRLLQLLDSATDVGKENGMEASGGDFYAPFWTDAKSHIAGQADLDELVRIRLESNSRRKRLYPVLKEAFLNWWNDKRRWSNQPFTLFESNPKSRWEFADLSATVKVENTIAAKMGDDTNRIVYPYFSEDPALTEQAVRLGLWVMRKAFPQYASEDMRIFDVQRSKSYSERDVPLQGDEEELFLRLYGKVLKKWEQLRKDYPW